MLTRVEERLPLEGVAIWNAAKRLSGGAIALVTLLLIAPSAQAFDPATDHTCVAYCGGGSAPSGGGGGYVVPAPSGPSPAELARRRQRAEALQLDKRAHAAFDRGDKAEAARLFEEAARLAPDDSNIQGNRWYTKGMLAAARNDYGSAVAYYKKALRYYPNNNGIRISLKDAQEKVAVKRGDWAGAAGTITQGGELKHYYLGRQALKDQEWDKAVLELKEFQHFISGSVVRLRHALDQATDALRGFQAANGPREHLPLFQRTVTEIKKRVTEAERLAAETSKSLKIALAGQARERDRKAEAQRKTDEQHREEASNPNYPKPPAVYRDAKTPRDYPDLGYYTPAQHKAHDDNVMGNVWSKTGNWVEALLSYQRALDEDPNGPFSKVIQENIEIPRSHLGPQKTNSAPATAPIIPPGPSPAPPQEKPKEIVQSNCTGWMTANGKTSRLCMDAQAHHYCEEQSGNSISRVSCQ